MMIAKRMLEPSRDDAVRLRRHEKMAMIHLMYAVTILEDFPNDIQDRIGMIENGYERFDEIAKAADKLLNELRVTVPEEQRMGIQHVAEDYEIRLAPKATPGENNVIMAKEEFRMLVNSAKVKCKECTLDDEECAACKLYQLLTSVLPLEEYHGRLLCPYNLGEWAN